MPKTITITAGDGEMLKVRRQTRTARQGFHDVTGEPIMGFADAEIVQFAAEARQFQVDADTRLVVEDGG